MELGGNVPFVVFDDTDLDAAVEGARREMGFTGFVCIQDLGRGLAVSERIHAGMIGLNRGRSPILLHPSAA